MEQEVEINEMNNSVLPPDSVGTRIISNFTSLWHSTAALSPIELQFLLSLFTLKDCIGLHNFFWPWPRWGRVRSVTPRWSMKCSFCQKSPEARRHGELRTGWGNVITERKVRCRILIRNILVAMFCFLHLYSSWHRHTGGNCTKLEKWTRFSG